MCLSHLRQELGGCLMNNCIGQEIIEEADYIRDLSNRLKKYSENYYELALIALKIERIGYEELVKNDD